MMVLIEPMVDEKTGETILRDIYIDGEWVGSRRTYDQCARYLSFLMKKEEER